jgi:hypothetical protein
MNLKSVLKPDASVMAAVATAGTVFAIYNLQVGSVATAHASDANHSSLESSRKKAGYTAFVAVAGLFLITRDGNIAILGGASIIAMELAYRHAIMSDPATGRVVPPVNPNTAFTPAGGNVTPITAAGDDMGGASASGY